MPLASDSQLFLSDLNTIGAPLIAIVACLGLAVDLTSDPVSKELDAIEKINGEEHFDAVFAYIQGKMDYLLTSRPTAVNLASALVEMTKEMLSMKDQKGDSAGSRSHRQNLVGAVIKYARFMLDRDRTDNMSLAAFGADAILKNKPAGAKVTIVTICNTGSLATSHYGTALGVVRAIRARDQLKKIVALETRPYNQGSRLTAFEIVEENMPGGTLICDSMAASLMEKEKVDAVVIGADRVCANGDTANKVGSYALALAAAAHQVPFYVASPFTTLDVNMARGKDITIEERPAAELLSTSRAPKNIAVWNPAFDVTPAKYISGIITEKGVILPSVYGTFDVPSFVNKHTEEKAEEKGAADVSAELQVPFGYVEQTTASLPEYLAQNAPAAMEVLGTTSSEDLECVEMGDGNLNLVFIVTNKTGPTKQVIVKQSLPYVRCVGESWPLTIERAFFEFKALSAEKAACPDFVPDLYYFSKPNGLMVMEYLAPPNIILRKGLIQGIRYPTMASDMGTFCAKTLFSTSGFAMSSKGLREEVEFWSKNRDMCELTEQVVFTEPYIQATNNRWTSPQLDEDKKAIENDNELKLAAAKNKSKFVSLTQALVHGDLHSGSVMCSPAQGQTFAIDPEFAFYGPMGFDTGAFVANLFLSYVSQPGHSNNGEEYATWVLEQIQTFWNSFVAKFLEMWDDPAQHTGYLYSRGVLASTEAMKLCQADWVKEILCDTISFAGMKMLRRIVGIAHVEDLDSIADPDVRAKCERHGLAIAKHFIKTACSITSIEQAIEIGKSSRQN